jgi:hypothetical protein
VFACACGVCVFVSCERWWQLGARRVDLAGEVLAGEVLFEQYLATELPGLRLQNRKTSMWREREREKERL